MQLYEDGKYQSAFENLEKAVLAFEKAKNISGQVEALNLLGECKANLNQCDQSLEILNQSKALTLAHFKAESSEVANAYYYLARSLGGCARKHVEGIDMMHQSINLKRKLFGEGVEVAFDYNYMGYMFTNLAQHDSAFFYLQKALSIRQKKLPPDDIELANTFYNLARNYENQYELNKALELHLKALKIRSARLNAGHESLANSLHQIGSAYQKLGNYDRALEYCIRALEISIKSLGPIHTNVAANYLTIGNLHGFMFNYREAIRFIKEGNSILEKLYGDKSDILPTYEAYLGRLYGNVGEHTSALNSFKKARHQAEKNLGPNHVYLGIVYSFMGDYYSAINEPALAENYCRKALTIFRKSGSGSVREADMQGRIGTIQVNANHFKDAFENYKLALSIYLSKMGNQNSKVSSLYQLVGDAHVAQNQFQKGLIHYQKAFSSVATGFNDTLHLFSNPTIQQLDNKPMSLRIARKKAQVFTQSFYHDQKRVDYLKHSLATYLYAIELIDDIASGYTQESARAELEKDSRAIYNEGLNVAYTLYSKTNDTRFIQDAFLISEKSKASILVENIRDVQAKTLAGVPDSLIERERDFKIELAYQQSVLHSAIGKKNSTAITLQEKNIFELQQNYNKLKIRLEKNFPSYFNFKYNQADASVQKVQQSLDQFTTLIEFFIGDSSIFKFTISKTTTAFEKIAANEVLAKQMRDYEKSLTDADFILNSRNEADQLYTSTAYELYEVLLKSSLDRKSAFTKLIIIPDGKLAQFSFGSLINQKAEGKNPNYKNLHYLSKEFQISYAYSSSLTRVNYVGREKPKNLFAGFAPSYSGNQFANLDTLKHPMTYLAMRSGNLPLPGAAEEVKSISQLMKGDAWLSNEATETNFKLNAANYDILHLAMHSLLNNEHPQYSELLFNHVSDSLNDGYLTVAEIYNLKFKASMVVLSACSSGFGKIQQGEGPISISRAFSYAGCPSVLMSLWKIPDEVTQKIMTYFYAELKNGKSKDEALRLAQIKFLNETNDPLYHHPYFWGSFVVMGDTNPLPEKSQEWIIYAGIAVILLLAFWLYRKKFRPSTSQEH
jgi:CHAT domain-containing protein